MSIFDQFLLKIILLDLFFFFSLSLNKMVILQDVNLFLFFMLSSSYYDVWLFLSYYNMVLFVILLQYFIFARQFKQIKQI